MLKHHQPDRIGDPLLPREEPFEPRILKGKTSYPRAAFTPASPSCTLESFRYLLPSEHCFDPVPILSIFIFLLFGRSLCVR